MVRRISWVGAVLTALCVGLAVARAAGLTVTAGTLGAGTMSTRCTTGGVGVVSNAGTSTVTSVTVSGIPASCGGGKLSATLTTPSASSSGGPVAIPAGGGSVTVTLAAAVTAKEAGFTTLLVQGP